MRKMPGSVKVAVVSGLLWMGMQAGVSAQLLNGGFESGSSSWASWGGVGVESWAARSGSNGLAIYGWMAGGGFFQDVAAAGSSNYTFAAYGLCENQFSYTLTTEMKIEFLGSNGVLLASVSKSLRSPPTWTQESISAVSPAGTLIVRPVILCSGSAGTGGAYKWDDVTLTSVPQAAPPGTNLLNGGIESTTGWTLAGDLRREAWAARTGSNGLAMYGWTTGGSAYQDVATTAASNYTFTMYGYRDATYDLGVLRSELRMTFFPYSGSTQELVTYTNRIDYAPGAWTQHGISGNKPAGAGVVRVALHFFGNTSGGAFKWDDAQLTSGSSTAAVTRYVSTTGSHTFPFSTWATASRSIEAALAASLDGGTVLVTNGTYNLLSQVPVAKRVTLRGVNGSASTIINGAARERCMFISAANALVEGFTMTNGNAQQSGTAQGGGVLASGSGATLRSCVVRGNRAYGSPSYTYYGGSGQGGGVYGSGLNVEGCTIENNAALGSSSMYAGTASGGGAMLAGGTLLNSTIRNNRADGGGATTRGQGDTQGGGLYLSGGALARNSTIVSNRASSGPSNYGATRGGGVYASGSSLAACVIQGNNATNVMGLYSDCRGGGAYMISGSTATNCLIVDNVAGGSEGQYNVGGGAYCSAGRLVNCTIAKNRLGIGAGGMGTGAFLTDGAAAVNCIAYYNTGVYGMTGSNIELHNVTNGTIAYSCTTPSWGGVGNTTAEPSFVGLAGNDFHLAAGSPCIDTATGLVLTNDLDNAARPKDGDGVGGAQYDMGCYERAAAAPSGNLLQNPGMENEAGWIKGGDLVYETWAARTGSRGLAMYGWTGNSGFGYQDVAASAATYTFSAWGYRDTNFNLAVHKPELKIEFFNSSFTMLGAVTNRIASAPASWSQYSVTGTRPASATIVRVVFVFTGPASGGAFKWDDANLVTGVVAGARAAAPTTTKTSDPDAQPEPTVTAESTEAPPTTTSETAPASSGEPAGVTFGGQAGLVVVTSDDLGLENLGMPAVDGNPRTAWKGEADAGGWWIAVQYPETIRARSVKLQLAKGSLANAQVLYSTDAKTWADLGAALKAGKVDLKYLWVIFPDDGSGAVPVVKEISIKAAK